LASLVWRAPVVEALLLLTLITSAAPAAVTVSPQEMAQKNDWVQRNLLTPTNTPPFSFTYNGLSSSALLGFWSRVQSDAVLDANRTQHVLAWTNAGLPLQVRCEVVEYSDFPVVEWTVCLKNVGAGNTPLIQSIQGLDTTFSRTTGPEFVLNGNQGDFTTADSYAPFQYTLVPKMVLNFAPPGTGKSSDGPNGWPYWNLQVPGGGIILALGWPGQWASSFTRDAATSLRVRAGQELTSLYLAPGEQIRTPLNLLFFWQGTDRVRSQNLWRHWYLAHNMPRVDGQLPSPQLQIQVSGDDTNAVASFLQVGIVPDICWRDAGGPYTWYPNTNGPYTGDDAWLNTGTWEVDATRYPVGFKPFSDWIHARGMKFLLWCEPERVGAPANTWLGTNHTDWLLQPGSVGLILNEGNPAAFNWLTNHFDNLIKANGVDWYREDMNGGGPCSSWRANDPSNRQGITENFYVQNHLAYWDALLAMNPGLRIDSCASGGRRNDLETMRRAVPLLRSDFQFPNLSGVVEGNQCHTYGLSSWLPFQGTGVYQYDAYTFRSFYLPSFGMGGLSPANTSAQQQAYRECRRIAPAMLFGDYYPLTPYSLTSTVWIAWQFDRPDTGEGVVQIFRRANSAVPAMQFKLQGLNADQVYHVQDFDRGDLGNYTGTQLMGTGLAVQLAPQQSAVLHYTTPPVVVSANASVAGGPTPLTVQFSATGLSTNGGALAYTWTFGDGGTSNEQNPRHTYNLGGRFIAQVMVQDAMGSSASAQVAISPFSPSRKMQFFFPGYNRPEPLTNFPALVVFGPSLLSNGFAYEQFASTNGWDLLFLDATFTQELNYEIESWNPSGNSYVWVQVPQLTTNTSIWAGWGDTNRAGVPAPCQTNGSVWANGYVGVWHLSEPRGFAWDSTANRTPGVAYTTYGTITRGAVGSIASAYNFAGGYLSCGAGTLPGGANPRTVSAWFRKNAAATASPGKELLGYGNNTLNQRFGLWVGGNGTANTLGAENCGVARTFPWSWDGQWHQLVAVLPAGQNDMSNLQLYYDGNPNLSATGQGEINTAQDELSFAAIPAYHTSDRTYDFDGSLDEVRISNVDRSANWIWAEWMNAASNATFSSYGPVQVSPSLPFQVTQTTLLPGNLLRISWQSESGRLYTVEACTNLLPASSWSAVATNLAAVSGVTAWTGQVDQATEFLHIKLQP